MKPITPTTIERIQSLAANPGLLARIFGRPKAPSSTVLDEIVATGELEASLGLLGVALAGPESSRPSVLALVDRMVRGASPEALAWLDLRARMLSAWRREWYWVDHVTLPRVRSLSEGAAGALGLATLHQSGFVREAAVRRLALSGDPLAAAFLLIRANDWVAPVHSAAIAGLEAMLGRLGASPFVPYLPLVDRLRGLGRNRLAPLADRILAALAAPDAAEALKAGCKSPLRGVRRRCIEIAMAARTFDVRDLIREGLDDPDPVVRILVAKGAPKALPWADLEPLVGPMLESTTPAARYSALDILWSRHGAGSREILERFLLDPHRHVRGTARWFLKGLAGFESAAAYRAALDHPRDATLAAALEGIGEVGGADDSVRVTPFLQHPRPRVRLAAIHALGAIGGESQREALISALSDPSPKVCRAARQVLLRGSPVDPERITWAALRSSHPHERAAAVALAGAHDHWVAGILLLRIATEAAAPDAAVRAGEALRGWVEGYNRVFTRPSPAIVAEFEGLVSRTSAIDPVLLARLRGLVPALKARLRSV